MLRNKGIKKIEEIQTDFNPDNRFDVIGEAVIADAILDRLVHTAHRFELKDESLRKKSVI